MRKLTVLLMALVGGLAAVVAAVVLTPPKTVAAAPALLSMNVSSLPIENNMPNGGPWDAH